MLDVAEISFFELDKLFTQSARAQKRKARRRKLKEREADDAGDGRAASRSRSPAIKANRYKKVAPFGGFTGAVTLVDKTIVVTGVPASADEKVLFKHFMRCGNILDVQIVRNRRDIATGVVIVEFDNDEALTRACALLPPHNEILGTAVEVNRADAQIQKGAPPPRRTMTRQQFTQQVLSGLKAGAGAATDSGPNMRKLHVKNLRPVVTEEDMRGIFKAFGDFDGFDMGAQECWITFKNHNDAQDAMSSMQGFQLVGQELQITMEPASTPLPAVQMVMPPAPPPKETMDASLKGDSDFGATGVGGSALTNRIELMKKLMSSHQQGGIPTVVGNAAPSGATPAPPPPPGAPPATATPAGPPAAKPGGPSSRTLLLQNMFTPNAVNLAKDPRFYEEIREDTHDECMKFGKVLHVTVDPRGGTGLIYVLYEAPAQRSAAEMALNGRWFEGKKIVAMGIDDTIWQALAAQAQGAAAAPA